jgi:hypothetical protein
MGKIKKGVNCSMSNCKEMAIRSISVAKAKQAGLNVEGRRTYLCREHYKEFKKGNKKNKLIERWRYNTP